MRQVHSCLQVRGQLHNESSELSFYDAVDKKYHTFEIRTSYHVSVMHAVKKVNKMAKKRNEFEIYRRDILLLLVQANSKIFETSKLLFDAVW